MLELSCLSQPQIEYPVVMRMPPQHAVTWLLFCLLGKQRGGSSKKGDQSPRDIDGELHGELHGERHVANLPTGVMPRGHAWRERQARARTAPPTLSERRSGTTS